MADRLNSEFNYRYQVCGKTPWEKLKILKGFLEGRKRARALEEVSRLKYEARLARLAELEIQGKTSDVLDLKAEILELESVQNDQAHAFQLNHQEIADLERLIAELYEQCEPTRIPGYTDDQMFEVNAPYEFAVMIVQQLQSEIAAIGHPMPATLLNAMSNPTSMALIKELGIVPPEMNLVGVSDLQRLLGYDQKTIKGSTV